MQSIMQTNEAVRHVDDVNDWKTFHNSMAAVETIVVVTAVTGNENSGDHPTRLDNSGPEIHRNHMDYPLDTTDPTSVGTGLHPSHTTRLPLVLVMLSKFSRQTKLLK